MDWEELEMCYMEILNTLEQEPRIRDLERYPQHEVTNSFVHSHNVAVCAFYLAKRKKQEIDLYELALGAMLHDFYLYDIKKSGLSDYQHGINHPATARKKI